MISRNLLGKVDKQLEHRKAKWWPGHKFQECGPGEGLSELDQLGLWSVFLGKKPESWHVQGRGSEKDLGCVLWQSREAMNWCEDVMSLAPWSWVSEQPAMEQTPRTKMPLTVSGRSLLLRSHASVDLARRAHLHGPVFLAALCHVRRTVWRDQCWEVFTASCSKARNNSI